MTMTRNEDDVNVNVKGAFDGRRILSLNLSWTCLEEGNIFLSQQFQFYYKSQKFLFYCQEIHLPSNWDH